MSQTYQKRPSEILGVDDPVYAYWIDRAVMYFGLSFEKDIEDATEDSKNAAQAKRIADGVLARWMDDEETTPQVEKPKFRDPAEHFKK